MRSGERRGPPTLEELPLAVPRGRRPLEVLVLERLVPLAPHAQELLGDVGLKRGDRRRGRLHARWPGTVESADDLVPDRLCVRIEIAEDLSCDPVFDANERQEDVLGPDAVVAE